MKSPPEIWGAFFVLTGRFICDYMGLCQLQEKTMITFKIGERYEDCKKCGEVTFTNIEYIAPKKIECVSYIYDRECPICGDLAYAETGFIFQDELYCEDCCPEGYGE